MQELPEGNIITKDKIITALIYLFNETHNAEIDSFSLVLKKAIKDSVILAYKEKEAHPPSEKTLCMIEEFLERYMHSDAETRRQFQLFATLERVLSSEPVDPSKKPFGFWVGAT